MKKITHSRLFSITRLAVILGLIALVPTASNFALAQVQGLTVPGANSAPGRVGTFTQGNIDVVQGDTITLVPNSPAGTPGQSQPLPKFTGINTARILSETGPVNILDDTINHGFIDVHGGIVNLDATGPNRNNVCDWCATVPQPVLIYDDVKIVQGAASNTGSLTVAGSITGSKALVAGAVGLTSQITGNLNIVGGNATISGGLTTLGSAAIGVAGGALDVLQVNGELRSDSIRTNTILTGNATLQGDVVVGAQGSNRVFLVYGESRSTSLRTNDITAVNLDLSNGATVAGTLTAKQLNATNVGRYYEQLGPAGSIAAGIPVGTWMQTSYTNCQPNDVLVSCSEFFGLSNGTYAVPPANTDWYAAHEGLNCTVLAKKTAAGAPTGIYAKSMCFSPDG